MANIKKQLLRDRNIDFNYIQILKEANIELLGIKDVNQILSYPLLKNGSANSFNSNTIRKAVKDGRFPQPISIDRRKFMTWKLSDILDEIAKFKPIPRGLNNE